jgi:hypothetical protein
MSIDPRHIRVGMDVVGIDGEQVGIVKAVRSMDFLVDRPLERDVYVPLDAVQAIVDATASDSVDPRVILTIRANSVDGQHWPRPG